MGVVSLSYSRHFIQNYLFTESMNSPYLFFTFCVRRTMLVSKHLIQVFLSSSFLSSMLKRLALQKKLNNASLKVLLVPALEHLNLEDVCLTQKTLHIVYSQCPHLKSLSLRNCGYIITDSVLSQLTKVSYAYSLIK